MEIEIKRVTNWNRALNAARRTVGKEPVDKEPSDKWKAQMLLAEHSPIRLVEYDVVIKGVKYWIAMHLARHHIGIEKFVCTQRNDRTGTDRDSKRQDALVDVQFSINAQAFISISRKRCCEKAHTETRKLWNNILCRLNETDPVLAGKCVRECMYRGFCPEKESCGFFRHGVFKDSVENYRKTE